MSNTVSNFKRELGISLEMLQWEMALSHVTGKPHGFPRVAVGFLSNDWELWEPLLWPQGCPLSIRVARGSCGLLSSKYRTNGPHLGLCPETPCSSPVATGISWLHSRFTQEVRPRLGLKQRTPLSSRVATAISWSRSSGLNVVKPPVEF